MYMQQVGKGFGTSSWRSRGAGLRLCGEAETVREDRGRHHCYDTKVSVRTSHCVLVEVVLHVRVPCPCHLMKRAATKHRATTASCYRYLYDCWRSWEELRLHRLVSVGFIQFLSIDTLR